MIAEEKNEFQSIEIRKDQFDYISDLTYILREMINVNMSEGELLSRILDSYKENTSYISIINLTPKVKFSLNEIKRLSTFNEYEARALEYVLLSEKRNQKIKPLVRLIKKEMFANNNSMIQLATGNKLVDELWDILEDEYNSKFRRWKLRGGIKKLIIKSVMVSYVLRNDFW